MSQPDISDSGFLFEAGGAAPRRTEPSPGTMISLLERAYRELRPRAPAPEMQAEFFPFSSINNTIRLRQGKLILRFSDLLEGAPEPVLYAIAHILLAKIYRKPINPTHALRYRQYLGRREITEKAHLLRQMRGRKRITGAEGRVYHLERIFDDLNARFFHGLLGRPQLTWSRNHARNSLGHYDPAHNAIVVSKIFDSPRVPRYVLEYLVYHEMLHLKHPVKVRGGRRCVHSPQFQAEERLFPELHKAREFLKML
jgi:predicted metal-dependent hydrolase